MRLILIIAFSFRLYGWNSKWRNDASNAIIYIPTIPPVEIVVERKIIEIRSDLRHLNAEIIHSSCNSSNRFFELSLKISSSSINRAIETTTTAFTRRIVPIRLRQLPQRLRDYLMATTVPIKVGIIWTTSDIDWPTIAMNYRTFWAAAALVRVRTELRMTPSGRKCGTW